MNAQPLLEAEDLKPLYADGSSFTHGISCNYGPGRIVCVVGPNGSGKTAYLRTLAAVDPPGGGSLRLLGRDATDLDVHARRSLRLKVAFISEGAPLLSVVNGLINVTLPAMYHRLGNAQQAQLMAEEILTFLDYPGRRDALPSYLNQHERLLLAIARCLMLSPELMFLDEPFHMTDNACRERESGIYRKLARERGLTLLLATHNLGFVKRHADEIVFVHPEGVWSFEGWKEFAAAKRGQVREFLDTAA